MSYKLSMSSINVLDLHCKRRKVWKPKYKAPSLLKLCRDVVIRNMGLRRVWRARKELPLPRNLIKLLTSNFSFKEFEVLGSDLSRDMRIHCTYPTRSLLDNSKVLMKCINIKSCGDSASMSHQLQKWTDVSHKNIMRVLLWFKEGDAVGVILEPFPKSLYEIVPDYRKTGIKVPEWLLWKMLHQICDVLLYLQRKQIVHPEISSKTVSLTRTGDILLHNLLIYTPSETELNVCVDAKDSFYGIYVAPERIKGQGYSPKQDSWSLGCIAYELVYLEPAFHLGPGENIFKVLNSIVNGVAPPRLVEADYYSPDAMNLILSCLMPSPRLRPTIEDMFYLTSSLMRSTRLS